MLRFQSNAEFGQIGLFGVDSIYFADVSSRSIGFFYDFFSMIIEIKNCSQHIFLILPK